MHYDQNDPYSSCFTGVNVFHFNDLNILPGSTHTLQFQSYSSSLVHDNKLERKYFLEHGNHHLDSDTTNNVFELVYLTSSIVETTTDPISVYPNPFTDFIRVSDVSESIQLNLYDLSGRMVSNGHEQLDDLGRLPTGIYFLQIVSGHSLSIQRVVKVE
jgi:hypothetical protein